MLFFSGIPEIDINLLVRTSDADLPSLCNVDRYTRMLCQDNHFWLERIRYYFSDEAAEIIPDQSKDKYWYYKLRNNIIAKTLKLTGTDVVISAALLQNIPLVGAEVYRSISLLLPLAITTSTNVLDYLFVFKYSIFTFKYLCFPSLFLHIDM